MPGPRRTNPKGWTATKATVRAALASLGSRPMVKYDLPLNEDAAKLTPHPDKEHKAAGVHLRPAKIARNRRQRLRHRHITTALADTRNRIHLPPG